MERIAIAKAREDLTETVNRVAYAGERFILHRRGRTLAALVPVEDLELLERLEDEADVRAIRKVRAEMKRTGEKPIPWQEVKAELGL